MRNIKLSETEKRELTRLTTINTNSVVQRRCKAILMSNMETYSMQEIVDEIGICRTTLYYLFNRWESYVNRKDKFKTLSIGKSQRAKPKLDPVRNGLPNLVKKHNGKTSVILRVLDANYDIKVSRPTLQKYLKSDFK